MKNKKISVILVALAFVIVVIFSSFFVFSINEIRADFSVVSEIEVSSAKAMLDGFKGRSLLFISKDKIKEQVEKNPYLEVDDVEKIFPNILKISINERVEAFTIENANDIVVLSNNGTVLKTVDKPSYEEGGTTVSLCIDGISLSSPTIGKKLSTDKDGVLYNVMSLANAVGCGDCIKTISFFEEKKTKRTARFSLRSGVVMILEVNAPDENFGIHEEEFGVDMIEKAFDVYNGLSKAKYEYNGKIIDEDRIMSDYEKFASIIKVNRLVNGDVQVVWSNGE